MIDRSGRTTSRTSASRPGADRRRRRLRLTWAGLVAALLVVPFTLVPALPAFAATWGIQKVEASTGPYEPGDQVLWFVTVSCSDPNADPCVPTTLTDPLPDGLELVSASIQSQAGATGGELVADTDADTVTYTADSVANGGQVQILITAQVDPDLPYSADGVPITNTATVVSDNATEQSASDDIVPVVPLVLDSETTKSIEPEGALAAPGTAATMTLGATNTSNDPVDTLVVQDPVDPTADPNPFTLLEYTGTGDITMPPNADTVTEEYWDGTQWLPLDDTVDPADVQGVRYTFSGDIQPGATATIPVQVQQSDAVEDLTEVTTVTNDTSSYVTHGTDESTPTTASDTYVITPPNNSVEASKSFDPATVSAGDPTTVTLGATNTGTAVTSMTISEPAPGTDSPFEGADPLTFTGFGPDGDGTGVTWPTGATAATVTFTCADGAMPSQETTTVNTLPNPPPDCVVVGFTVEFTGDIVSGAAATIPFTADTDPDQDPDDVTHPNTIAAEVPNADAAASADLVTLIDRLATDTTKVISPSTIPAVPGQSVIVQLPTQLLPFGPDGSTTNADQIVISDPADPSNPTDFWDHFVATEVRSTDVPAGSTLTINYWDGTAWVPATDCGPYTGPMTVSCDLPADAQGVQFVYDSTGDGFPPGTQFQPNFVAEFTGPATQDDPLTNCGASSASSDTVEETEPAVGCAEVDPFPVDGDGTGLDFMDKTFLGDPPVSVLARSDDQVTAQLTWSTSGFSGVDPMVISDIADPEDTPIEESFYDAFDLVRVEPIDTSVDPLIGYDRITGVELFIDGAWVPALGDPCPCDGSFPGYTLDPDLEQPNATAVRLTYSESENRGTDDPLAPQPGDGVARSTQADGRHLNLTFEVRDYRRGAPTEPVLGSTNGTIYNTDDPGLVNNTARATGTFEGVDYTDVDDDNVLIIDQPLNVTVAKDWTGGPISVPPPDTPADAYPSTTVTITGTNASAAKVDQLRLVEPGVPDSGDVQTGEGTSPFDVFNLTGITLTPPEGATSTTVTLTSIGGTTEQFDEAAAEALTAADLVDVVGVEVAYEGLVMPGATGSMDLILQLRVADRYTTDPIYGDGGTIDVDTNPVPNGAVATIDDPGGIPGEDVRLAWDDAEMPLQVAGIDIVVGKSFEPAQIVEPSTGPVTMTLTGQPVGPSRAVEMVIEDSDPQFWNSYDFVGFDGATLTAPIQQVLVEAYTGGTFVAGPGGVSVVGGAWEGADGEPSATFALPDGVAPEDVQGLRFTFTRTDGSIWENPATPVQAIPISVERREEMRTGGPVLTDLEGNPPAPGETAPGVTSNTVQGTVTGADLVVDPDTGDLVPVSAADEAPAQIVYVHATNGVEIVKDFDGVVTGGTQPPAAVFPMNITVTNTGNRPIFDLVVTDPMPTDAAGGQLVLADVPEPFSYELAGDPPDPANGDPLPTDADEVTVVQVGDIESLTFSFPTGTVLEVGQSYVITVQVQFRLGLEAGALVQNTAGVTADRPWDECVTRLNPDTGACEADSDVTTVPSAVLAQSKYVRATDGDELDVMIDPAAPNQDVECVPDANGFYAYPCTPVIIPGHDETWRIHVDNVGNLPMNQLVLYDRLPTPGDTGSFADSPRGSEWEPLTSVASVPQLVDAPEGAEATHYYSTVDDYCMDDLTDPINQPCPTDDPTTGWVQLTADTDPADLAAVTALKTVVTFAEEALFEPGEFIELDATTTTPPQVPDAGDRSIAWNSAAVSGVVVNNGTEFPLLPTEGTKVGVATASGSLAVAKLVVGPAADQAPETFLLFVQCTSAVGTPVETVLDPIPISVTPPAPTVVPDLPYGAECTITEDGSNGETELIVGTVTIESEDPAQPTTITAVNRYEVAGIDISKDVVTDAVDDEGQPVPFGPFEVTVECTFLGEPVYAEGYGPLNPMVVTIEDGETVHLDGFPVGSVCTVTETGTGNAGAVTITVTQGDAEPVTTDGPSTAVTLVTDADDGTTGNTIELTNVYDVGQLDLLKVVDGDGAEIYGAGPFTLALQCTFDDDGDGPGEPRVVFEDTVVLGAGGPLDAQIPNLVTGAVCTVTETDDGGATSSVVEPSEVTIGSGDIVTVTATNTFDVGSIVLDKVVDGDGADLYGDGPFTVTVECTYEGEPVAIPGGAEQAITPGTTTTIDGLPVGAACLVTETDDGDAAATSMTVTEPGEDPVEAEGTTAEIVVTPVDAQGEPTAVGIVATNTFDLGAIGVDKLLDGDGADLYGTGPFEVALACTFDDEAVEIPGGSERELVPGTQVLYEDLPVGAECAVTETATAGATSTVLEPEGGIIIVPPAGDGEEPEIAVVTLTNVFDLTSLEVVKVVDGDWAASGSDGVFEVTLACTWMVDGVATDLEIPGGPVRVLQAPDDLVATYDDLPVGAQCELTETVTGDADGTSVTVEVEGAEAVTTEGETVVVPLGDTTAPGQALVTVTNSFDPVPPPAPQPPDPQIPRTGSDVGWLGAVALLLVGAGAYLVTRRRRTPGRHPGM
ncbi:LPXTG cell wall anchor domain-containing protein [Occultella glacieicola]|uniref:LPXTG cell wall anchor domain-containing protein n=1 Tax=Occultella glacieicola TaxID=2518684 RepID=A0ABY2EDD2_9MICO|nr:DUF5979 domain-containing protein [Occultella glacieicola]TDE98812.1 LPXTG cell wall anchor domain-containing protein [Occultella glacieicola]